MTKVRIEIFISFLYAFTNELNNYQVQHEAYLKIITQIRSLYKYIKKNMCIYFYVCRSVCL